MKNTHITLIVIAITFLSIIASCKKSNDNNNCGGGLLCATVDGVNYTGDPYNSSTGFFGGSSYNGSYGKLVASSTSTGGYYMIISGNNGTANTGATWQIDFTITQLPVNGGTYTTQAGSASFDYYAGSSSSQLHYVTDATHTGTVTVNNLDTINNLVSGTFSYTATEASGQNYTPTQHTITNGSFTNILVRR